MPYIIRGQLFSKEDNINHALLKGIQHIADERGEVQPLAGFIHDGLLGIFQRTVIAVDFIVDGIGQRETLHLLPAGMIQRGSIDDPRSPSVAVAEGMDIDEVEMRHKGANQTVVLFPEPEPLLHEIGESFRGSGRMDGPGLVSDFQHTTAVKLAVQMDVIADTICDLFRQRADVLLCNGATIGVVTSMDGVDYHSFILVLRIFEMLSDLRQGNVGAFYRGRCPGIQKNALCHIFVV